MSNKTVENNDNSKSVTLDTPLTLPSGTVITTVIVRKPSAGALRGLALSDLLRLQTDAIQTILPRVTEPMIVKQEVQNLDPADLVQLGTAVSSFLLPKADRADFQSE
ncbi:phage tail assembly protein [Comamonas testosteroni]|uniref:Phage tail assembly protein n=1 Tax=Comamonas testosteroni TaxID=285 RepID=A0A373FRJ9_COMTE|nr:phage tail assembly protein [Comamonas testosteroni]RGE46132.1 phage tail assembly protein [Comamonas testosteroni]